MKNPLTAHREREEALFGGYVGAMLWRYMHFKAGERAPSIRPWGCAVKEDEIRYLEKLL